MITEVISEWKSILWAIISSVVFWVWWSLKKRFVPREEFEKLQEESAKRDKRIAALETAVAQMPSSKEIAGLRAQLTEVAGELKVFNQRHVSTDEKLNRVQMETDRIMRFLMEKKP